MSFKLNCTIPNFYNDVPTQWFRFIEKKIFLWYCRNRIFLATLGLKEASLFTILLESSHVLSTLLFVSVVLLFLRVFSRTACARNAGELRAHGLYSPHLFTRFSWVWTRRLLLIPLSFARFFENCLSVVASAIGFREQERSIHQQ